MLIEQFYDKGLAHGSYAIISENEIVLIDPARDPQPYYEFADKHDGKIIGVIETHPHADFVSSHLEIHQKTGASIYVSKLLAADYEHSTFDEGDILKVGKIKLQAINTPGHSPDSICILVIDEDGSEHAIFTGDTLFVGDVGRPDLRESAGNIVAKKEQLAREMYHSTREKLMTLPEDVIVYPAHGPGSLCGKNLSPELNSTIGKELRENYALQSMSETMFVDMLIKDQPFVPKYFGYNVMLNKKGAEHLEDSLKAIPRIHGDFVPEENVLIIDTRKEKKYKAGHLKNSINLQDGSKFETWLGSVVSPDESFYLIAGDKAALETIIRKTAKIGYERQIRAAVIPDGHLPEISPAIDLEDFDKNKSNYTIVDIRNTSEVRSHKIFDNAINIPLHQLRERYDEIPKDKAVVVHCAGGYRSAAGSSIIAQHISEVPVLDMSDAITHYPKKTI
ncbi:MBL fold metallo-hydrolase [Flavihumibacter sp. R14]|nr:MBL fold metallo-hydrolase [Flavihumibacter soli]